MNIQPATSRRRNLTRGILTSAAAKIAAIIVQMAVFPLALHALGTSRYAAFLAIQSFLSWVSVFGFGLTPVLPHMIAKANAAGDLARQRNIVTGAVIMIGTVACLLEGGLLLLGWLVSPKELISAASDIGQAELWNAYLVTTIITCAMLIVIMQPAFRSGYQQLHYVNIWAIIASSIVAILLIVFGNDKLSIAAFSLMTNGPLVPCLFLDLIILFRQRPYLLRGKVDLRYLQSEIRHHSGNALAIQIAFMLFAFVPTFAMSKLTSPSATAQFASVLQPLLLAMNGANLIFQPMVSAFADAYSHADSAWLKRNYVRFLSLIAAAGLFSALVLAFAGPAIFRLWLHRDIGIDQPLCALFGIYFFFLLLSLYYFNILSSVGQLAGMGKIYLLQGILAIGLGSLLASKFGPHGMVIGLSLGMASTGLFLPWRVQRCLVQHPVSTRPSTPTVPSGLEG